MITVTKEIEFDAGHRVPTHGGKCRSPHGHRYRVQIECGGERVYDGGPESGMLADFGFLKDLLMEHVHDPLDHAMIVWKDDADLLLAMSGVRDEPWKVIVFTWIPTAENIAEWVFRRLAMLVDDHRAGLVLRRVTVWETPTSTATVTL